MSSDRSLLESVGFLVLLFHNHLFVLTLLFANKISFISFHGKLKDDTCTFYKFPSYILLLIIFINMKQFWNYTSHGPPGS